MANKPLGNDFWEGELDVVNVYFRPPGSANFIYLGKTTADTEINLEQDLKDILYQQDGTKRADKIRTGINYLCNTTFGEIDTELLEILQPGITKSSGGHSLKGGRSLYQSMKKNESGVLRLIRIDSDGISYDSDPLFILNIYNAAPEITSAIIYGADTQRNIAVSWHIFWDETEKAFWYSGYASSFGLTPV